MNSEVGRIARWTAVYLNGVVIMGAYNEFPRRCVIGDAPQDLKYKDEPTECASANIMFFVNMRRDRSNKLAEDTIIVSNNFLMANSHVAHNCLLGDHVILANGGLLAGHVSVRMAHLFPGLCCHQYVRIGTLH